MATTVDAATDARPPRPINRSYTVLPEQDRFLRDREAAEGRPKSAIVRDLIDRYRREVAELEAAEGAARGP